MFVKIIFYQDCQKNSMIKEKLNKFEIGPVVLYKTSNKGQMIGSIYFFCVKE